MHLFDEFSFLLSIHSALVSSVVPELRAVTYDLDIEGRMFNMDFVFDREIDNILYEVASVAITEIDLPLKHGQWQAITAVPPQAIPFRSRCAYCRYEPNLPNIPKISLPLLKQRTAPSAYLEAQMNQSLLGKVTSNLRFVCLKIEPHLKKLSIQFCYHGPVTQHERSLAIAAFHEGISIYPDYQKELEIIRIDHPKKWFFDGVSYAYAREEDRSSMSLATPDDIQSILKTAF